jgi:hypothetical protein
MTEVMTDSIMRELKTLRKRLDGQVYIPFNSETDLFLAELISEESV